MKILDIRAPKTKIGSNKFLTNDGCENSTCNCGRPNNKDSKELKNLNKSFVSIYAKNISSKGKNQFSFLEKL